MINFELLGPLMERLYQDFVSIYYIMLPVCFALSIAAVWFKSPQGSPEFVDALKRVFVTTLILSAFPEIANAILFISSGIADCVDQSAGLEQVIEVVKYKIDNYSLSKASLLISFNDLLIATISFVSFLVMYCARYLMIAIYHFYWIFFMVAAPLLLLFNVFSGTAYITKNLFKGMIEVASWKIVWAILSAMMTSLSLGDAYKTDGNYITLIILNFIIAIAMLFTPMFVKSLVEGGANSTAGFLGQAANTAMMATPVRGVKIATETKKAAQAAKTFTSNQIQRFKPKTLPDSLKY